MKCTRGGCVRVATSGPWCRPHGAVMKQLGLAGWCDVEPTRVHAEALIELGWSCKDISATSGVAITSLRKIRNGTFKRVRRATERKMLAIPLTAPEDSTAFVSALGARRRVDALRCMQWPVTIIAEKADIKLVTLYSIVHDGRPRCHWTMHMRIAKVYDELSHLTGPSKAAATKARKAGAVPPLAWDDIDDPDEVPNLGKRAASSSNVVASEARFLASYGASREEIAARLGVTVATLRTYLGRAA